jgi:hypothetical protein
MKAKAFKSWRNKILSNPPSIKKSSPSFEYFLCAVLRVWPKVSEKIWMAALGWIYNCLDYSEGHKKIKDRIEEELYGHLKGEKNNAKEDL